MPAFMTPNNHTPWNYQTFSFVNSCYTLYAGNALTWCGLTFVTLHNIDSKRLYSNNGTWMNMQGVLVAWWQSKSAEPLLSTRQMTMEDWWNEDNHFHRSVQDGYHKKPACQSSVHRATKLLHSKPCIFTVVKKTPGFRLCCEDTFL
jgi:hypothetical protein